jgi:putative endonuclease
LKSWRQRRGDAGEQRAAETARSRGYRIVARNFRARRGELDLILAREDELVVAEVRLRRNTRFGSGADTVDHRKQRRLVLATQEFLQRHPNWQNCAIRFDVISLDGDGGLDWIENAFFAE